MFIFIHTTSTSTFSFVHPHNSQSIICNQKRHWSQPLKKMLKDTYAKTWLKVFGANYIARCRSQSKHPPQTLSFTFRTCIFNNHMDIHFALWSSTLKKTACIRDSEIFSYWLTEIIFLLLLLKSQHLFSCFLTMLILEIWHFFSITCKSAWFFICQYWQVNWYIQQYRTKILISMSNSIFK